MNQKKLAIYLFFIISLFLNATNNILASTQSMDAAITIIDGPPSQPPISQGDSKPPSGESDSDPNYYNKTKIIPIKEKCKENWICTEWSDCIKGIQIIECFDSNNCKTTKFKPLQQRACELKTIEEMPIAITKEIPKTPEPPWFLIIIAVITYYFVYITHKKKERK